MTDSKIRFTIINTLRGEQRIAYKFKGVDGYFYRHVMRGTSPFEKDDIISWTRPFGLFDGTPEPKNWNK